MKILYGNKFTTTEKKQQLPSVYSNVLVGMKILCEQAAIFELDNQVQAKEAYTLITLLDENNNINEEVGDAVKALWSDPTILKVWERRSEYQIIDSVQYYFNRIDVIKMDDYLPDKDDILHARVRTSGIVTEYYTIEGTMFEMYDVGGQRNERKKWIHCFEGVTAVIFVAAVSEFDQNLFEDTSTNRIIEALDLFEEICNNIYFVESSMILFLNKIDLFREKIKVKNIKDTFDDYTGLNSYEAGLEYFKEKFLSKRSSDGSPGKEFYVHATCATDSKNVKFVFDSCKHIVMNQNFADSGFSSE